jgi:hypothetical protein
MQRRSGCIAGLIPEMGYEVVLRELEGGKNSDGTPFMVKRYYLCWGRGEPREDAPYLSVWADGSLTAVWKDQRLFLYEDQWCGMIAALKQAMIDKRAEQQRRAAQWLAENSDKREHYGYSVDLSINEAKTALTAAPMRWNGAENAWGDKRLAEVLYEGSWRHLCRTDLKDDVCTFGGGDESSELETLRSHYLERICFGARVGKDGEVRFAVVDGFSDG